MRQAGHVETVAFAGVRHFRHQVFTGRVKLEFAGRFRSATARVDFDLIGGRDDHLLGHVPDTLVHHEHHRNAKLLGQVKRLDGEVEALLRRVGRERDDFVIAVRSPARLHHVGLRRQRGQARRWAAALHVDEHAGRFGHHRVADVLHHEREARTRGDCKRFRSGPSRADQRDGSGQFIFHLNEPAAHGRDAAGETFDDFGRRRDRISGGETRSGR